VNLVHLGIHLLVAFLLPPLLLGVIVRTKAFFAGRRGAPLLQVYFDLAKLFRKGFVQSRTTSWVFRAGPVASTMAAALAVLLIPLGHHLAPLRFAGDFVVCAYLFGFGRFLTLAAALDTGSAFEGMGAARDASFACLSEGALFLAFVALARGSGSASLSGMLGYGLDGGPLLLVLASLFVVFLAENCRIPVDDPTTHLELTMIHEVMVLDHGGPALGLVTYGAALKLFCFGAFLVDAMLAPTALDPWASWAAFLAGMLGLALFTGMLESGMARLRLCQVPSLLVAACLLSAFAVLLLYHSSGVATP
jgi:formate hydrogenlyase subunit 4